jgi:DNA-binding transcriptional LysR family regulator
MELRHLRYFVVTAEELHFTRAARRIGIAQPPLTTQIRALEEELGVQLFDRKPGQVRLTEAGTVFLEEARGVLDQVAKAALRCRMAGAGLVGRVGVGFTESASFCGEVTWMLRRFRELYGTVELALEEQRSTQLVQMLKQGRIDVAFVRLPLGASADIRFDLISSEPLVVALPSAHRFAQRRSLRLQDLRDEPFVLYPRPTGSGLSDKIVAACEAAGFMPRIAQRAPQLSSTINLVASSLGIAVVPACMKTSRADNVRYVPLRASGLSASLGIAYRAHGLTPAVRNLLALVGEAKKAVVAAA